MKADCSYCGHELTEVRPGKHQCDYCELMEINRRLEASEKTYMQGYREGLISAACRCITIAQQSPLSKFAVHKIIREFNLGSAYDTA